MADHSTQMKRIERSFADQISENPLDPLNPRGILRFITEQVLFCQLVNRLAETPSPLDLQFEFVMH